MTVVEVTTRGAVPVARVEMNWLVVRIEPPDTSSFCHGDAVQIPTLLLVVFAKITEFPPDEVSDRDTSQFTLLLI